MDTIDMYMTEIEARGEHAFREAYYIEYMRLFDSTYVNDHQRQEFWSALAHQAGKLARERVFTAQAAA
ncbi:MAG: hypothetical protein WKH64_01055 [Chloroflexia bacterium]